MDLEKIQNAIISALYLLRNEVECVEYDQLRMEYLATIKKLEAALEEIRQDA